MAQYGIPARVFGSGIIRMAHFPNEHIRLDDLSQVAEITALTLIKWCGQAK